MGTELESGRQAKLLKDIVYDSPSGLIRLTAGDIVTVGRVTKVSNGFFTKERFEPVTSGISAKNTVERQLVDRDSREPVFIPNSAFVLLGMDNLRLFVVSIPYEKAVYETAWKVAVVASSPEDALKIVQGETYGFHEDIVTIEEKPLYQEGVILVAEK